MNDVAAGHVEGLAAGVAVRPLGDADERQVGDAEFGEHRLGGRELALAAVDEDEVGPGRGGVGSSPSLGGRAFARAGLLEQPREAPAEHLAHHGVVVAGGERPPSAC